jgi:hypothetical protein
VVILSEERSDEPKEPYGHANLVSAIGVLRLAFAKPGERSLSMTLLLYSSMQNETII